ncbi:MAG: hypothetical protein NZ903_01965 [Candidatus Micrarchaeota archaeon]|nr:hypothetical protein [Candidatus Micrarchaeota archaeon]
MARVCIVGKEEVKGNYRRVKEDIVISTIRNIKRFFKIAAENELVVCDSHFEEAVKKRKEFESSLIKIVALVAVITVIAIILAILNNSLNLIPSTISLVILLFIFLIFVSLFKYFPAIEERAEEVLTKERKVSTKGKKTVKRR